MNRFLFAAVAVSDDALQVVRDALAAHGYVIAAIAAVVFLVPLVLKAFGKSVPLVDPLLELALMVLRALAPKKADPAPTDAEKAAQPGVENVLEVKDISELKK